MSGDNPEPMLAVHNVFKHFGGIYAVNGAGFSVQRGSITALIGPNGAGKTSLFNIVSGFYRADRGTVEYKGRVITRKSPHVIARAGLVRTFQLPKALTTMPVLDNMMLAAPHQPGEHLTGLLTQPLAVRRRERVIREQALELLETFGLAEKAHDYAGTLSGGQRKLLELARALMVEPSMVLLDEPMAGVNPVLREVLLASIRAGRTERGITFLLIEHDLETVMAISDTVAVMNAGEVIFQGKPGEVQRSVKVIDAYLGTSQGDVAGAVR